MNSFYPPSFDNAKLENEEKKAAIDLATMYWKIIEKLSILLRIMNQNIK